MDLAGGFGSPGFRILLQRTRRRESQARLGFPGELEETRHVAWAADNPAPVIMGQRARGDMIRALEVRWPDSPELRPLGPIGLRGVSEILGLLEIPFCCPAIAEQLVNHASGIVGRAIFRIQPDGLV